MKLHYDFLTQSQMVVIRTGDLNVSFASLKKLVDVLKRDFPQAKDGEIFFEYLGQPEYRQDFYAVKYRYTGNIESVPQKYTRFDR